MPLATSGTRRTGVGRAQSESQARAVRYPRRKTRIPAREGDACRPSRRPGAGESIINTFSSSSSAGRKRGVSLSTVEKPILDGLGSVDVALEKGSRRIACEVSVTTDPAHEVGNVQKCLAAGFETVVLISSEKKVFDRGAARAWSRPRVQRSTGR